MAEKKKLGKVARRKAIEAWRECGKTHGEANRLVDEGKRAPTLKARQKASQSVLGDA